MRTPVTASKFVGSPPFATLSPDMRSIALTYESQENGGTLIVQLLNVATGQLRTISSAVDNQDTLKGLQWLDNTHLYATYEKSSTGSMTTELVLFDIAARTGFQPIRDFTPTGQINEASYTYTPDGTKLFVASYQTSASSMLSAITSGSSTSTASAVIYQLDKNTWAKQVLAYSNSKLLVLAYTVTASGTLSQQIWTLNGDGTGQNVLTTLSSQPGSFYNSASQTSFNQGFGGAWSTVSRDTLFYALNSGNQNSSAVLVGTMQGGKVQVIADTSATGTFVNVVGWTTM